MQESNCNKRVTNETIIHLSNREINNLGYIYYKSIPVLEREILQSFTKTKIMKKFATNTALLLMTFGLLLNAGCKKDDEDDTDQQTKTQLLTSGVWRISGHTSPDAYDYDLDGTSSTDIFSQYDACEKDNTLLFKTDGTYEADEGALKCDPDDAQMDSGTWAFIENETKMLVDGETIDIIELTSTRFSFILGDDEETITFSK